MTTYSRNHISQRHYNITGKRIGSACTQVQHGGRADKVDWPFPNQPVSHRRPLNSRTQDSLGLCDFEKITITQQHRGPLSSQEHHSNGSRQHPREDLHRLSRKEVQMAKEIQAKEAILQEKVWRVAEKIRQKIHVDTAQDERLNRRQPETKNRLYEQQWREPVRGREMTMQERRQNDVTQFRTKHSRRNEDRMWNTVEEEERSGWRSRETEIAQNPQLHRKESKATPEFTFYGQEESDELNKLRMESVIRHARRDGDGKYNGIWGGTGKKLQDGTEKPKVRQQNTTSVVDEGWTTEGNHRAGPCKKLYGPDDEHMHQMNQRQTSHRDARRKLSGGLSLPPVFGPHSGRPEQEELKFTDNTNNVPQPFPCRICNRKFTSQRLEVHVPICTKLKQSHRQAFNSYANRTKGSAIEEFWKTHTRSKTPEVGNLDFCLHYCGLRVLEGMRVHYPGGV